MAGERSRAEVGSALTAQRYLILSRSICAPAQLGSFHPTRKYLRLTVPSLAGNGKPHLMQEVLPRCRWQASIVTILYSASQTGQLKGIGSDLLNSFNVILRSISVSRIPPARGCFCPRVPGRVGSFLHPHFCSQEIAEGPLGSLIGDANPPFNDGEAINSEK